LVLLSQLQRFHGVSCGKNGVPVPLENILSQGSNDVLVLDEENRFRPSEPRWSGRGQLRHLRVIINPWQVDSKDGPLPYFARDGKAAAALFHNSIDCGKT